MMNRRWDLNVGLFARRLAPIATLLSIAFSTHAFASGTVIGWGSVSTPSTIPNVVSAAAGFGHGLALKDDGSIASWGANERGQRNVPPPNSGFTAVAAGLYHSLGLRADGSVVAWGANESGQCSVPEPNLDFIAVSAGEFHSLGLKRDGSIVAWGGNSHGQCDVPSPNSGFRSLSAGRYHSIALRTNGSMAAWGRNDFGQLTLPVPNSGLMAVTAGYSYNLALRVDGSILAWGKNDYGQCNVPSPNIGFTTMAGGYAHSLAVRSDGVIIAWGANNFRQCTVPPPNADFTAVAVGFNHSVAVKGDLFSLAVYDVPEDQGGQLLVTWRKHPSDPDLVDRYDLQRYDGDWFTLKSLAAANADTYGVMIPTTDILTIGQPPPGSFYRLLAHTNLPGLEYATAPYSAYSIDNLPPPKPQAAIVDGLEYRVVYWDDPLIPDLAASCVYRGGESGFEIGEPIACPEDYFLESHLAWYFYRVRFRDTHGNWSELSDELHGQFPTNANDVVSAQFGLFQNSPNPFNPVTTLRFDLAVAGQARLSIHDLAGRRICVIVDGRLERGAHEAVWNGRDDAGRAVGSGVYLAKLESNDQVSTIRMALLR